LLSVRRCRVSSVAAAEKPLEVQIGNGSLPAAIEVQETGEGRPQHLRLIPLRMAPQELLQALEKGLGHFRLDGNLRSVLGGLGAAAAKVIEGKGHIRG